MAFLASRRFISLASEPCAGSPVIVLQGSDPAGPAPPAGRAPRYPRRRRGAGANRWPTSGGALKIRVGAGRCGAMQSDTQAQTWPTRCGRPRPQAGRQPHPQGEGPSGPQWAPASKGRPLGPTPSRPSPCHAMAACPAARLQWPNVDRRCPRVRRMHPSVVLRPWPTAPVKAPSPTLCTRVPGCRHSHFSTKSSCTFPYIAMHR